MPTLLCVPIMVHEAHDAIADAAAARDAGADILEFRIDELFSGSLNAAGALDDHEVRAVLRLVAECPLPCIVTCRAASEGGHYDGDDAARVALYQRLGTAGAESRTPSQQPPARSVGAPKPGAGHPPRYLDIEHAHYQRSANLRQKVHLAVDWPAERREDRPGLILSMHDFQGRPPDLLRRIAAMGQDDAARIVKIAITARSIRDNLELFDLLRENAAGKPTIALAMGRFGLMSRVLAPKFGGFLTFAALRRESATAPGQPTIGDLLHVYRLRSITARTKVYGVIGWPPPAVEHSLSPLVHNAGFEAIGHDGVYLPLPIAADQKDPERTYLSFKATLEALLDYAPLDLAGLSVTMPFKEHAARWLRQRDGTSGESDDAGAAMVRAIRAANTLAFADRRVTGANTDAAAVSGVLAEAFAASGSGGLAGKRVAIIGAGGVARAAAWACIAAGARATVFNRTRSRAQTLVADLLAARTPQETGDAAVGDLSQLTDVASVQKIDAIIQCTTVGMRSGPDQQGLSVPAPCIGHLRPGTVLLETIYRPIDTPLVRAARARALRVIDGIQIFVAQAALQFQLWTAQPAPRMLFDRICRENLESPERTLGIGNAPPQDEEA